MVATFLDSSNGMGGNEHADVDACWKRFETVKIIDIPLRRTKLLCGCHCSGSGCGGVEETGTKEGAADPR